MSEALTGHEFWGARGWHHSEETKRRMSESHRGRRHSEDAKRRLSEASKNRPPASEETKRKMSESLKAAWKRRKEACPIIPVWNRGRTGVYSEETLRKMSESQKVKRSKS